MPRRRHRMRSRQGQLRRVPSSPSTKSPSPSSDFSVGHYPRTRSGRGHPSYGSALFTFCSALNRPRITAHISVVFQEEAQEGEPSSHQDGPGSVSVPTSSIQLEIGRESLQVPEAPASSAPNVAMAPIDPGPSNSAAAPEGNMDDTGWCWIIEEPLDV